MRSTTISFRGTREEVNALNIIARRNKKFVADMVRQALFAQYAADIQASPNTLLIFKP